MSLTSKVIRRHTVVNRDDVNYAHSYSVAVEEKGVPYFKLPCERLSRLEIDEVLATFTECGPIHDWFVRNVQGGANNYDTYPVSRGQLVSLLDSCEKVLQASHLVPAKAYAKTVKDWQSSTRKAEGLSDTMIKNISVAHKLLPIQLSKRTSDYLDYDGAYLGMIDRVRVALTEILTDGVNPYSSDIYYKSNW